MPKLRVYNDNTPQYYFYKEQHLKQNLKTLIQKKKSIQN